ncbi:sulfurtransferase [Bacillus spongiae]|uniref:Sulfurtransferase n=1 Tax=Bacillus spongiae TaxID=2683610 RepID=A0ABU8HD35_9BACI
MKYVVEKETLLNDLAEGDIKIIDCSYSLHDKQLGRKQYEQEHLPNALYFDLERDLSAPVSNHGGRHPLPSISDFENTLGKRGILPTDTIVLYDQGEGAFAARCWWQLRYLGHEKVYVLNGGMKAWRGAGFPLENSIPISQPVKYISKPQRDWLADVQFVEEVVSGKQSGVLLDSRSEVRYTGKEEPIDPIPGHIPGAVNFPWEAVFSNGHYKSEGELRELFGTLPKDKPVVVYCGSGVTATPNVIALKIAGFHNIVLYAGSYSDWVSYEGHSVVNVVNQSK